MFYPDDNDKSRKKKSSPRISYEANYDYIDEGAESPAIMEKQEQDGKRIKTIAVLFCYLLFVVFGGLTTPFVPNAGAQILNIETRWDRVLFQTLQAHYHILHGIFLNIEDAELALDGAQSENEVFAIALRYGEIVTATSANLPQARAAADIRPEHASLARQMILVYESINAYAKNMETALVQQDEAAFDAAMTNREAAHETFVLFTGNLRAFSDMVKAQRDPVLFGEQ